MRFLRAVHPHVMVRVGDDRVRIDLRDHIIAKRLYLGVDWEPEFRRLVRAIPLQGAVCLDIGANIGIHTLLLSRLVCPGGRVYAFEPEPRNFALLAHNLRINDASNVAALRVAVGDTSGTVHLAINPNNYGDHRIVASSVAPGVEVSLATVDELLREVPDGMVKFAKIDVQGYELRVLQGMRHTLDQNPDAILVVEVFPAALQAAGTRASALAEFLRDLGLAGWEFTPRLLPLQEPWLYDLIPNRDQVDVIVSRNRSLLATVLWRWRGERGHCEIQ